MYYVCFILDTQTCSEDFGVLFYKKGGKRNGTDTSVFALRTRANVSHVVDECSSNDDLSQHRNLYTNMLMVQAEDQVYLNTAFKRQIKPECEGDLNF